MWNHLDNLKPFEQIQTIWDHLNNLTPYEQFETTWTVWNNLNQWTHLNPLNNQNHSTIWNLELIPGPLCDQERRVPGRRGRQQPPTLLLRVPPRHLRIEGVLHPAAVGTRKRWVSHVFWSEASIQYTEFPIPSFIFGQNLRYFATGWWAGSAATYCLSGFSQCL